MKKKVTVLSIQASARLFVNRETFFLLHFRYHETLLFDVSALSPQSQGQL